MHSSGARRLLADKVENVLLEALGMHQTSQRTGQGLL